MSKKQILQTAAYLMVSDIHAAVKYYTEKLGFKPDRLWGDPPTFAMPKRDDQIVMLSQVPAGEEVIPNSHHEGEYWDVYFWIADADVLFAEFTANGAEIAHKPYNADYGVREFWIRDQDSHILAFGQITDS
jgi:catechol 2,3-dioxygenase-like lactoylglutathione lyase family enzyme